MTLIGSRRGALLRRAPGLALPSVYLPTGLSASWVAAGGVHKLFSAAASSADVVRASDSASMTIGFSGQNFDRASASTFQGSSTLGISKLYDQTGNGKDLTQPTAAQRLQAYLGAGQSDVAMLMSHAAGINSATSGAPRRLLIPSLPSVNRNAITIFLVLRSINTLRKTEPLEFGDLSANADLAVVDTQAYPLNTIQWDDAGTLKSTAIVGGQDRDVAHAGLDIMTIRSDGTSVQTWMGDRLISATTNPAITSRALSLGGALGMVHTWNAVNGNLFECVDFAIAGGALTTAEMTQVRTAFRSIIPAVKAATISYNVFCLGDSITEGHSLPYSRTLPRLLDNSFGTGTIVTNYGQANTTASANANFFSGKTGRWQKPGALNVCTIWLGSNDVKVLAQTDNSVIVGNLQSVINGAFNAGFTKVCVGTMLPRGDLTAAQETQRQNLNALIKTNGTFSVPNGFSVATDLAIVDVASDSTIGTTAANNDPTLYLSTDKVHLTELGHTYAAPYFRAPLAAWGFA